MKNVKIIGSVIIAFVLGIITSLVFVRQFVMPDLAMDVAKFGYDAALNAYQIGHTDGENDDFELYEEYFTEDMSQVSEWQYKYIK